MENTEPKPLTASQRYYQSHKDKRREYGREYYRKNRDRILKLVSEKRKGTDAPVEVEVKSTERAPSPIREYKRRGVQQSQNNIITFN